MTSNNAIRSVSILMPLFPHEEIDVLQGICITLSRDKSLTSDHEIRYMSLFRHDSGRILKYTDDLNFLKVIYGHLANICCD